MDVIDERFAIYTAVLLVCSAVGVFVSAPAAAVTFGLLVIGVEAAYWIGGALSASGQFSA